MNRLIRAIKNFIDRYNRKEIEYRYWSQAYHGKEHYIVDEHNKDMKSEQYKNVEIVSTALSKGWSEYGHTEPMIFIVTYKIAK